MKIITVLLIIVGIGGIALGAAMFGDIGVAAMIAGFVGLLSGSGLWLTTRRLKQLTSIPVPEN